MRYQARWSNGFWVTFDCERFVNVETHNTQKIANDAVTLLNTARRK